jgi:phosphotransferase system IIA component
VADDINGLGFILILVVNLALTSKLVGGGMARVGDMFKVAAPIAGMVAVVFNK